MYSTSVRFLVILIALQTSAFGATQKDCLIDKTVVTGVVWDQQNGKAVKGVTLEFCNDCQFKEILKTVESRSAGDFRATLKDCMPKVEIRLSHYKYSCPQNNYPITPDKCDIGRIDVMPKDPNWNQVMKNFIEEQRAAGASLPKAIARFWGWIETMDDDGEMLKAAAAVLLKTYDVASLPKDDPAFKPFIVDPADTKAQASVKETPQKTQTTTK